MRSYFYAFALLFAGSQAFAAEAPASFADLAEKLTPSVVNISSTQKVKGSMPGIQMFGLPEGGEVPEEFRDFFEQFAAPGKKGGKEQEREVYSLGSGFILDEAGYIVTNNHVIADAEEVSVILSDDTKLKAKIVGRDAKTDLALLKVDAGRKLPAVTLGDSDTSRVGDWVIAIGNPFGLGGTVTAGIISARARNINSGPFDDFLQTDAAINRGNSGGPMFNIKGEVIGINTAIFSPTGGSVGIGFAVPMSLAKSVIMQLKSTGKIERAWLGVKIQHVTDEIADSVGFKKPVGALVMDVTKGGPADKAGLKTGDIVTKFDGKDVKEMRNLPRIVADTKIGKVVSIEYWRKGATHTTSATLKKLKEDEAQAKSQSEDDETGADTAQVKTTELLGLSLATLNADIRAKFGIEGVEKGVVVVKVKPSSEAAKRGLKPGDVILQLGDANVESVKDVAENLAAARKAGRNYVLLRVARGAESVFITLPATEKKEEKK